MSSYDDRSPERVLERLAEHRCIAVVRSGTAEDALAVSRQLVAAGFDTLEITYTTPDATEVLRTLRADCGDEILLGGGTISGSEEAHHAAEAGADFLVSPGSPPGLVEEMLASGILVVPGVLTPTEIATARCAGVLAVKLFPAIAIGTAGMAALRGPFPDLAIIPTGGITIDEVSGWLDAGAHAVGVGAGLTSVVGEGSSRRHVVSPLAEQVLRELKKAARDPARARPVA